MIIMNTPLVSIIVPNYNYAQYLDERMESILNQTYQNYEILILDDNSTDNSLEIIEKYRLHPKVSKVIVNEHNSGSPFKQWERGIKEASGDIIWIAESDDTCLPTFLSQLVEKYIETNAVVAFCRSQLIDENGHKQGKNYQMRSVSTDLSLSGQRFVSSYLGLSNEILNASCAIFSREKALEVDTVYMKYRGAGDWLFWINLSIKGNVCFINQELNKYRQHNNTTSSLVKNGVEFKEMKTIYESLLDRDLISREQFYLCRRNNLLLIRHIKEIAPDIKKELYKMWHVKTLDYLLFIKNDLKDFLYDVMPINLMLKIWRNYK